MPQRPSLACHRPRVPFMEVGCVTDHMHTQAAAVTAKGTRFLAQRQDPSSSNHVPT